jgi:hypothetical protein
MPNIESDTPRIMSAHSDNVWMAEAGGIFGKIWSCIIKF